MTLSIINGNSTGFTLAADNDQLVVQTSGQIGSTSGSAAVLGLGRYGTIINNGDIAGVRAIWIGNAIGTSNIVNSSGAHMTGADASAIYLEGNATIRNAGDIFGYYGVFVGSSANVTLFNAGTMSGTTASYTGSTGVDTVINSGRMFGNVELFNGNDFYDGRGGTVVGTVSGGAGNDILIGGNNGDKLSDTSGGNWIVGGGGDDEVTIGNGSTNGTTTAWAGEANFGTDNSTNDTLFVEQFSDSVNIFLGGKVSDVATGAVAAWIWGFENATATIRNDSIIGTSGNNIINGNGGTDWLVGNGGYDQFVFTSTASTGSTISGFSADLIDLHNIDANTVLADDQAFAFKTVHTSNAAGELVFTNFGGGGQIELYTNADNTVDATIFISYAAGAAAPTASDFWL